jgi:hypothetical protein
MELRVEVYNFEKGYGVTTELTHIEANLNWYGQEKKSYIMNEFLAGRTDTLFIDFNHFLLMMLGSQDPSQWVMYIFSHHISKAGIDQICDFSGFQDSIRQDLHHEMDKLSLAIENDPSILDKLLDLKTDKTV